MHLKPHFYDAANMECNPESWAFKPAAAFEKKHNLTGIAAYYIFPELTIENETSNTAVFFEHHACSYSSAVFACYKNPGICEHRIEKIASLDPTIFQSMQEDWQTLLNLNPELKQVRVDLDDPLNIFDALVGVACLFNIDDLNLYLTGRMRTGLMTFASYTDEIPGYKDQHSEIKELTGQHLGWVASPETLSKIKAGLIKNQQGPAPQ